MNNQLEREEQSLEDDLKSGCLSQSEYNYEMKELHSDYRNHAEQSAQEAYDDELNRW